MPRSPMHPRLVELIDYITRQRAVLFAAVSGVPEALRDHHVAADTWSIAEVLEHLHRVESGIARLLDRAVDRAQASGLAAESELGSLLGSLDSFGLVRRDRRITSPDMVAPRGEYNAGQALAALAGSRKALLAAVEKGNGLALGEIVYPHPLFGSLNFYQWVLFVGQHEARHAAQIDEIGRTVT